MSSEDGHADLATSALDPTGDVRAEIVLWDQERDWICTQDRPFTGGRVNKPSWQSRI
jgi:hypothetical protein